MHFVWLERVQLPTTQKFKYPTRNTVLENQEDSFDALNHFDVSIMLKKLILLGTGYFQLSRCGSVCVGGNGAREQTDT